MCADRAAVDRLLAVDPDPAHRAATAEPGRIIRAAELGRLGALRLMAELGFYVNVVRRTSALHEAAGRGDVPLVRMLLELGADPGRAGRRVRSHAARLGVARRGTTRWRSTSLGLSGRRKRRGGRLIHRTTRASAG